jgi:hypothetical protein
LKKVDATTGKIAKVFGVPLTKNARYAVEQAEFDLFRASLAVLMSQYRFVS